MFKALKTVGRYIILMGRVFARPERMRMFFRQYVNELEQLGVPIAKAKAETVVPADKKALLQGIEAENRQKLWRWFIVATLAVLLLESVLAGRAARRAALATEGANP